MSGNPRSAPRASRNWFSCSSPAKSPGPASRMNVDSLRGVGQRLRHRVGHPMFVTLGAFLAGLYLILKDLIPWLNSQRTGETRTRAYNSKLVLRSEEPDRFSALQRNRIDGMIVGLLAIGIGIGWFFFGLFGLILL